MLNKLRKFFNSMNEQKSTEPETKESVNEVTENVNPESNIPESPAQVESPAAPVNEKHHTQEEVKEEVTKILKTCYDPEIPVDVLELGLIYDILVATNNDVMIVMTLTSPSCPVAGILPVEIEQKIKAHPMVNDCKVQLTFDPPWNPGMMSEVAKLELGFL